MQYLIITDYDIKILQRKINRMMGKGWKPLGGVVVFTIEKSGIDQRWFVTEFAQTMTREKNDG